MTAYLVGTFDPMADCQGVGGWVAVEANGGNEAVAEYLHQIGIRGNFAVPSEVVLGVAPAAGPFHETGIPMCVHSYRATLS